MLTFASKRLAAISRHKRTIRWFLAFFITSEIIFGLYWLGFYPAVMNNDGADQWAQSTGLVPLADHHPYVHTLWLTVLRLGTKSLGVATSIQLTFSAVLFAVLSTYLVTQDVPKWSVLLSHTLITLAPAVGIYNVSIGKDIAATQFVMALLLGWLILSTCGKQSTRLAAIGMIGLALITFAASFFRHDHVVLAWVMILLICAVTRIGWKLKLVFSISLLGLMIVHNLPIGTVVLPRSARVDNIAKLWVLSFGFHNIPSSLDTAQRAELTALASADALNNTPCTAMDDLAWGTSNLINTMPDDPVLGKRLDALLVQEVLLNPGLMLGQRICVMMPTIGFPPSTYTHDETIYVAPVVLKQLGLQNLKFAPKSDGLHQLLVSLLSWTDSAPQRYFLWNHLPALMCIIIFGVVGLYYRSGVLFGIFVMYSSLFVALCIFNVAGNWRYLLYVDFLAYYTLPILFFGRQLTKSQRLLSSLVQSDSD